MWQHSIATAIIAKIIAKELRIAKPETFFISGLLHDVGKLILITAYKSKYIDLIFANHKTKRPLNLEEKEVFGFSHDELGNELIRKWNIDSEIADAVNYHHSINLESKQAVNISIIYLSNIIAKIMDLGKSGNSHIEKPDNRIWDVLNLKPGFLKSIHNEIEKQFYESSLILKL